MIRPFDVALISAIGLSLAAVAVLASLWRTGIPGVRHWLAANLLASLAFAVFTWGPRWSLRLVPEVGHLLLGCSAIALVAGFRAFTGKSSLIPALSVVLLAEIGVITWLHLAIDLPRARVIITSCFYALATVIAIRSIAKAGAGGQARYPYLLARVTGLALMAALLFRIVLQWRLGRENGFADPIDFSAWNLVFLSLGALLLPLLSFAGVTMVHDRMLREIEKQANQDFLTGAWTRRALQRFAEHEIARAERQGVGLALLVMDIDRFKAINDRYGHSTGDEVLKDLVLRAQGILRRADLLARTGGEEFSILLPDSTLEGAIASAERLRRELQQGAPRVPYTVSIGIAIFDPKRGWNAMCDEADLAMYEAKRQGRDRVAVAPAARSSAMPEGTAAA